MGILATNVRSSHEDGFDFSVQLDDLFLHVDGSSVRFTGEGEDRGTGLYLGLADGGHTRLMLQRFEEVIGASPAVLPEGTHTIHAVMNIDGVGGIPARIVDDILVSDIAVNSLPFFIEQANPNQAQANRDVGLNLAYNPDTRTLTYTEYGTIADASINRLVALGER